MDKLRDFADQGSMDDAAEAHDGVDAPPAIGTDERRMHVRAYNAWAQMLGERSYPSIDDLDLDQLGDFGAHCVLLDFSAGVENPAISYLGDALRTECSIADDIHYISEVPSRSLLSRLTDHYLQIIANQAPIGFEAEFVNERNINIAYRGILLPFSSDDDTIDFMLGVINWKQVAEPDETAALEAEIEAALRAAPVLTAPAPVWADGPTAHAIDDNAQAEAIAASANLDGFGTDVAEPEADAGLGDWLAYARDAAAQAQEADARSHSALYAAIGRAHDFAIAADADPEGYAELLDDAGLAVQDRAPMTPIVKLVFGAAYDKTRITEYATILAHARREGLGRGALAPYLARYPGGVKALVKAERRQRTALPGAAGSRAEKAAETLRQVIPYGFVPCDGVAEEAEFVLFVARQISPGQFAMVGLVEGEAALLEKAMLRARTGEPAPRHPD